MNQLETIPVWLAVIIAAFVVLGSTLVLLGALGFARLHSFYDRLHAPALGSSWGVAGIIIASMIMGSYVQGRAVLHELVIGTFVMLTTPVTMMLLGRAALYRDRMARDPVLPDNVMSAHHKDALAGGDAGQDASSPAVSDGGPGQS